MNVVCVGDCGVDRYEPDGSEFAGGISLNVALRAREVFDPGTRIQLLAPLGSDDAAARVRARLQGVDIEQHFTVLHGHTPVQHIRIEPGGERRFTGYDEGVLKDYRVGPDGASLIGRADLVVAPVFRQNRGMFESAMACATDGWRAVDLADFGEDPDVDLLLGYADRIDIAFAGLDASQGALVEALRRIAADTGVLIVVTLGAAGSRAFLHGDEFRCPAVPVAEVVDTTGAGDAFAAAFLAAWLGRRDPAAALSAGAKLAAVAVRQRGPN